MKEMSINLGKWTLSTLETLLSIRFVNVMLI